MTFGQSKNEVEWPSGIHMAAALEIVYRVGTNDGHVPGAIDVFLRPGIDVTDEQRMLVQRLVPFGPADKNGRRRAVLQIPPEILTQFASESPATAIAEVTFDQDAKNPKSLSYPLSLDSARIIPIE